MLLVFNAILAFLLIMRCINARVNEHRATNTVFRYLGDKLGSFKYSSSMVLASLFTLIFFIIGNIVGSKYCFIPTLLTVPFCIWYKYRDAKIEPDRIDISRYTTKAGLQTIGHVGSVVGTVIGTAVAGPTGGAIGLATGTISEGVAKDAAEQMTDQPELPMKNTEEAVKEITLNDKESEVFNIAERCGIDTSNRTVDELCDMILERAPQFLLEDIPEDLSKEERVIRVMGGG